MTAVTLGVLALLLGLLVVGVPVGFALAVCGAIGLLIVDGPTTLLSILRTAPLSVTNAYEFVTVPMFLLMAELVILSGIATQLFVAAATWTGRIRGGLGVATALAGAGFGAISGSSTASAATLSVASIPGMIKQGYEPRLAYGVVAISGTLAMLIPPSLALVLFGIIGDVSIAKLLIGGIVPGLLVTATIAMTVVVLVLIDPRRAPPGRTYSLQEKLGSLRVAGPFAALFATVTVVIYFGVATPTEASGLGAMGALLLTLRARKLSLRGLAGALINAAGTSCMVFTIILGAKIFGYFLTLTRTPQQLVTFIDSMGIAPWLVLLLILFFYLVLGCILDQVAILILTVPIVLPVVIALGYDPVWFGVLIIVIAEVGMLTPPIGLNVFVVARYSGTSPEEVFRGVWPHVFAHMLLIGVLVLFPQLVLWLPSRM